MPGGGLQQEGESVETANLVWIQLIVCSIIVCASEIVITLGGLKYLLFMLSPFNISSRQYGNSPLSSSTTALSLSAPYNN